MQRTSRIGCFLLMVWLGIGIGAAQAPMDRDFPPGLQLPAAAQPGPGFDVDRATEAWLALLSPE